jgi:uncharacterized protein (DUF2461 family)
MILFVLPYNTHFAMFRYFGDKAVLHIFEFDVACARNWMKQTKPNATLHVGDQANPQHLQVSLSCQIDFFTSTIPEGSDDFRECWTNLAVWIL